MMDRMGQAIAGAMILAALALIVVGWLLCWAFG